MAVAAPSNPGQRGAQATAEDVKHIVGEIDDPKVLPHKRTSGTPRIGNPAQRRI